MNLQTALCPEEEDLLRVMGPDSDDPPPAELVAHVDNCESCRRRIGQLETALRNVQAIYSTRSFEAPTRVKEAAPSRIGKYYVIGSLGQGGQGNIYRALHPNLGKEVVIKLSRTPREIAPGKRDRMTEEARLLQELNHPNLGSGVLDLDFELGAGGMKPFLVMEYIRGLTLNQYVREKKQVSPDEVVRMMIPLARGLAAAHQRGIRHLDIKPGNIVIDELGRARLIDFGLATLTDAWEKSDDIAGGTLEYMAPEQVSGEPGRVDGRADVYGLGGVLFFLLTGQPPRVDSDREILLEKATKGEADLAVLAARKAPRALQAICRKALAPDPANRFATADAFADALDAYLRLPRRRAILLAGVGACAALGLGVWAFWPKQPIPKGPHNLITTVRRRDVVLNLQDALPLGQRDGYEVRCPLPRGAQPALFYFDSTGKFDTLSDVHVEPGDEFDQLQFPKSRPVRLGGPAGTEFLLVCSGKSRPTPSDIEDLFTPRTPWPSLPQNSAVLMDREKVHVITAGIPRPLERAGEDNLKKLQDRLEEMRRRLRERFTFFAGVAYPLSGD